jgi:hypothetical protein
MTHAVVIKVAESRRVWMSYSITKLQYRRTARNMAVSSWDLSDKPATQTQASKHFTSCHMVGRWYAKTSQKAPINRELAMA